jgi:hypothetical protein
MTIPKFNAEVSLYTTSGHYRTGRQAINFPAHMISTIDLAAVRIETPVEVIEVFGEAPSSWGLPFGWGSGGWVGSGGTGIGVVDLGGGVGGGGGGGGGGTRPLSRPPRRPVRLETLGMGPNYSQLRNSPAFTCENAGVDAAICHACSHTPGVGFSCICYYCQQSSDQCTEFYNVGCPPR